jgi:hypothetical protein
MVISTFTKTFSIDRKKRNNNTSSHSFEGTHIYGAFQITNHAGYDHDSKQIGYFPMGRTCFTGKDLDLDFRGLLSRAEILEYETFVKTLEIMQFSKDIAVKKRVSRADLHGAYGAYDGDFFDYANKCPGVLFRAAFRYAQDGYIGGFPTCGGVGNGDTEVILLNKSGPDGKVYVDRRDYEPGQIGLGANANSYDRAPWLVIDNVRSSLSGKHVNGETWDFGFPNFESSGTKNGVIVISKSGV